MPSSTNCARSGVNDKLHEEEGCYNLHDKEENDDDDKLHKEDAVDISTRGKFSSYFRTLFFVFQEGTILKDQ